MDALDASTARFLERVATDLYRKSFSLAIGEDARIDVTSAASAVDTECFLKSARVAYLEDEQRRRSDGDDDLMAYAQMRPRAKTRARVSPPLEDACRDSDDSRSDPEVNTQLNPVEAVVVVSVLEDVVDRLAVLACTGGKPPAQPDMTYVPLLDRFGETEEKEMLFDMETDLPTEEAMDLSTRRKLQRDRALVEVTLRNTIEELIERGQYSPLSRTVVQEVLTQLEEQELRHEVKSNRLEKQSLVRTIAVIKRDQESDIECKDEEIAELKDILEDAVFQTMLETSFMENWEAARTEQNDLKLAMAETTLSRELSRITMRITMDNRINCEVENYIRDSMERLENKIEQWKAKMEDDGATIESKIVVLSTMRDYQRREMRKATESYNERHKLITEYRARKEAERQEALRQQQREEAATKIQAWWRGTMVRNGLGRFRKKKGKGKGKKGKDEKKKKKK